jgi:RecG-like helicase
VVASWVRRFADRIAPSADAIEADELRARLDPLKCSLISLAPQAVPVRVAGTVRSVTLRPRAQDPALEVELYDGSGSLTLVFLGRRAIRGLTPGRHLVARGRVTRRGSSPVMYNPTYDLLPQSV